MRIVDDFFDLCAGSWDRLPLRKEVVELAAVVAGATEAAAPRLAARGHRLTVSLPAGPGLLVADLVWPGQVLTNLLEGGQVSRRGRGHPVDRGGRGRASRPAGPGQRPGIGPDLLPRVFDRSWQGPEDKAAAGLGLGLALVKSLAELHGGSVAASSDGPGAGAEFIVHLPGCSRGGPTSPSPCPPGPP